MAFENPWQVGKHFHGGTINFIGHRVLATGEYVIGDNIGAYSASQSVLTRWDEIDIDLEPLTEEISSSDSGRQHTVILQEALVVRCQTINQRRRAFGHPANQAPNPLQLLFMNFDVMRVVVVPFNNEGDAWDGFIGRGRLNVQMRKGRNIAVAQFNPVDPNQFNPFYAPG